MTDRKTRPEAGFFIDRELVNKFNVPNLFCVRLAIFAVLFARKPFKVTVGTLAVSYV